MVQRARKYREIKKRVKAYMKELKKDSERENIAVKSYLKNVTYQRKFNNFYEVVDNNNENVDNCHFYEDNMNELVILMIIIPKI